MAAAVDIGNFFLEENGSVASSFTTTASLTVASGDNYLAVMLSAYWTSLSATFTGLSWNGNALTYAGTRVTQSPNGNDTTDLELWVLQNPPPGTGTLAVTASAALGGFTFVAGFPLSGVHPSAPRGSIVTAKNNANPAYPIGVTAAGAQASDVYIGWSNGNVTTASPTGLRQVALGATGGGQASYIAGVNLGGFSWSGTGGSNTNALAMAVPIFGVVPQQWLANNQY